MKHEKDFDAELPCRVPLLACPAVQSGYQDSTAGQASSGTREFLEKI